MVSMRLHRRDAYATEYYLFGGNLVSPILPGDVILRPGVLGPGEDVARGAYFDEFPQVHEAGEVRGPGRLLHVVGDDDDGVVELEFLHELFDSQGG
jgi:hypothetical protein